MVIDLWSLSHIASGIVLGALARICKLLGRVAAAAVTVTLVGWELLELLGHSRGWSWGLDAWWAHESWENRWLSDIGVGLLGAAAGYYGMNYVSRDGFHKLQGEQRYPCAL
jgi:hypothetical protein